MAAHTIAQKFRRALRNETGATFTLEQLHELAGYGVLNTILQIEAEELCPTKPAPTLSATTGSTPVETAKRKASGKLPPPVDGRSLIEALARVN